MDNDEKDKKDQKKPDNRGFFDGKFTPDNNNGKGPDLNPNKNKIALGVFIFLIAMFVMTLFSTRTAGVEVAYSDFLDGVKQGNISSVNIKADKIIEYYTYDNVTYTTRIPYPDNSLLQLLEDSNIKVKGSQEDISVVAVLLQLIPWVIFIVFAVMLMKQASGNGQMMKYGKSLAKENTGTLEKTTFDDVAGQKEAKYELEEVVDFLKHPDRFTKIGAKIPKGVLLVGPPGTGKTLMAKAVAGEAGVSFFHTSGSDFVEMFVGMGAARVRDLFAQGRKHAPCILFIDELDAVGRQRGSGLGGGHDEREQTLNQMLVEMDGFDGNQGVIVIAATNRPDVLDKALLRAGRFDRQVVIDLPDVREREDILKIHCKKVRLGADVDLERVARATPGASGADLANLVNEAALFAARQNHMTLSLDNFEEARDKMLLGVARTSKVMTVEEKTATAYHEAGHALLYYYLDNTDPLHKVTIIAHGRALGLTMSLPEKDVYTYNKSRLLDQISIAMGGYVAENLIYGQTTTGTSNDIKQATNLARRMVTEFGMSNLGFIALGSEEEPLFLGREIASHKDFSESTASKIDTEISKILDNSMKHTTDILSAHKDQLDILAKGLVDKETLDDSQIRKLLGFEQAENRNSDFGVNGGNQK